MKNLNEQTSSFCLTLTLLLILVATLGLLWLLYYVGDHLIFVNINVNHNERILRSFGT